MYFTLRENIDLYALENSRFTLGPFVLSCYVSSTVAPWNDKSKRHSWFEYSFVCVHSIPRGIKLYVTVEHIESQAIEENMCLDLQ